ncbi:hypothetical protein B4U80_05207 [Leptotrombidium deliense]|uniref:Uncharacterized protein n=1 Tax=Leptotrombidium deliense TaxID=299467 RepID=A0A443SUU4_9ACAR|nr:hypothetical protein B4U80_05207 [Leptotrombidium deliense]
MYGTPLSLLQLPPSALPEITAKLNQPGVNSVRFLQDGRSFDEIRHLLHDSDVKVAQEVDIEVGFTCKKCHMTYPAEVLCLGHQRASCFAKQSADIKATLKLVQIHIECRLCRERFASVMDYKFHCESQRHKELMAERQMKCVPKMESMNSVNGGLTQNVQMNNSTSIANDANNLFLNGNESQVSVNLLNYLTKGMANSAAVYSNSSEAY